MIREEAIHTTARGKRLLVTHGDLFDAVVQCARAMFWLYGNVFRSLDAGASTHDALRKSA